MPDRPVRRVERAVARRVERRLVVPLERGVGRLERGVMHPRPVAHMLHIGKTGGTAMKDVFKSLDPEAGRFQIVTHRHMKRLTGIPRGEKVFFVVRDPVERFVSGFNSRLRQGKPRYFTAWTPAEEIAFGWFQTADSLGRALSSEDVEERAHAYTAMISIRHVRDSYWDWFRSWEYLESRRKDLLLIQWCPDLTATFPILRERLGLPEHIELPTDEIRSHRSPSNVDRTLSDLARSNLERWYGRDFAFIDLCGSLDCFVAPSRKTVDVVTPPAAGAPSDPLAVE
jgi:hypothetical protein